MGILQPGSPPEPLVDVLRTRLNQLGYSEGRNIVYEYRWAEGKNHRLMELAKELVDLKVDAISTLSTPAAIAAKTNTKTIPIIFSGVGDPVATGIVASLAHPGGNITGVSTLATELSGKRLEVLREIVPSASPVAMFWNDTNPSTGLQGRAADYINMVLKGSKPADIPVEQPTKFELVINLKTAKQLALTIPATLLGRADEVIE